MGDLLETLMIVAFGISWPLNAYKAWKARTAKAISLPFYLLIFGGYIVGIASKIIRAQEGTYQYNYVFFFYVLNLVMVGIAIGVYFRNRALDRQAEELEQKKES